MYLITVLLLMLVLPVGSIGAEHSYFHSSVPLILLVGKWFVFWGAGVRLFLAGYDSFFSRDLPPKKYSASEATMHWRSCANWVWRISQLA